MTLKTARKPLKETMDSASIGIEIALAVVIGMLFGGYLDGALDIAPWGTLFFTAAGIGAAVKAVLRTRKQYLAQQAKTADEPGGRQLQMASYDRWSR